MGAEKGAGRRMEVGLSLEVRGRILRGTEESEM